MNAIARAGRVLRGQSAPAVLEWAGLTVDDRKTVADAMAEQAEQRGTVQEDLDQRVDALLREMEETSDRAARRAREEESGEGAPSLMDVASRKGAGAGDEGEAPGRGVDSGAGHGAAAGGASARAGTSVMQEAAAELAQPGEPAADSERERGERAASGAAQAGGASVEALDELLAAAAADVMADEEEAEGEEASELGAAIAATRESEGAAALEEGSEPAVGVSVGDGVDAAAGAAGGAGRGDILEGVATVLQSGAASARPGPPNAPAATMAVPAERPGLGRHVADVFVHGAIGAAASARPHAIRLAWRVEQYTLRLRPGARATIKCVAVWTLLNALAVWAVVMMQSPPKPPLAEEQVPTVISGAPGGAGGPVKDVGAGAPRH